MPRRKTLTLVAVTLFAASVSGCVEYYSSTYGSGGPGGSYRYESVGTQSGYGYYGGQYQTYPSRPPYRAYPYNQGGGKGSYQSSYKDAGRPGYSRHYSQFDRRDWRDGDDALRRQQRDRLGTVPLEERRRLDRQERFDEGLDQRIDSAARRRQISPGGATGEIGSPVEPRVRESSDAAASRRLERSTQAERQKQKEAARVRRQLLERQAIGDSLPPPPAAGPAAIGSN